MASRYHKPPKGKFLKKLIKFLFVTGLLLVLAGFFSANALLGNAFPTQNPIVGMLGALAVFALAWGMLIGAALLLLATALWLITAPNKIERLRMTFGSIRVLLGDWRTYAVVALIAACGLFMLFAPEPKNGLVTEWHDNGEKKSEQVFVRGSKISETIFVDGQPSLVTKWYRGGQWKDSEKSYVDGELARKTEFLENGHKFREEHYANGLLHGAATDHDNDGQVTQETMYVKGEVTQTAQLSYFDNGQMKGRTRRPFGKEPSEMHETYWHENGEMSSDARWVFLDRETMRVTGTRVHWYQNGQKSKEQQFVEGRIHGPTTTWYDNGQKMSETNWAKNKQIGLETYWERDWTEEEKKALQLVRRDVSHLQVPTAGLLAYFQFESNGEDSATVRSLDNQEKVFYSERFKGNYAADFKGWGSFTGQSKSIQPTKSLTIALWVKFKEEPKGWSYGKLISNSTKSAVIPPDRVFWSGYWIDVVPRRSPPNPWHAAFMHPRFYAETNIGDNPQERRNELVADRPIALGTWNHIAVVFDGVEKKIYVNGQLAGARYAAEDGKETEIVYASTSEFLIGSWKQGEFSGELDEILIYDRGLSEDEIQSTYLNTRQ